MIGLSHGSGSAVPPLSHAEAEGLISARFDTPLNARQEQILAAHLHGCAACSYFAEQMSAMNAGFRAIPRLPASPIVSRQVRERINQPRSFWERLGGAMTGRVGVAPMAASAAIVVLAVAGYALFKDDEGGPGRLGPTISAGTQSSEVALNTTITVTNSILNDPETVPPGELRTPTQPTAPPLDVSAPDDPTKTPGTASLAAVETNTAESTIAEAATDEPPATDVSTRAPTKTEMPTEVPTATNEPTETDTPKPTSTDKPEPTDTDVPTETETAIETPTDVPTETEVPAETDTPEPTETETDEPAASDEPTQTEAPTEEPTATEEPISEQPTIEPADGTGNASDEATEPPVDEAPTEEIAVEEPTVDESNNTIEPLDSTEAAGSTEFVEPDSTEDVGGATAQDTGSSVLDNSSIVAEVPQIGGAPNGPLRMNTPESLMVLSSDGGGSDLQVVSVSDGSTIVGLGAAANPIWSPLGMVLLYQDLNSGTASAALYDNEFGRIVDISVSTDEGFVEDIPAGWSGASAYYLRVVGNGTVVLYGYDVNTQETSEVWRSEGIFLSGGRPIATGDGFLIATESGWLFIGADGSETDYGSIDFPLTGEGFASPFATLVAYPSGGQLIVANVDSPGSPIAILPYPGSGTPGAGFTWAPSGEYLAVSDGYSIQIFAYEGDHLGDATSDSGATVAAPQWLGGGIYYVETSPNPSLRLIGNLDIPGWTE